MNLRGSLRGVLLELAFLLISCIGVVACDRANRPRVQPSQLALPEEKPPEFAYIPSSDVQVVVHISSKNKGSVGEWMTLSASRRTSGEWRKVPFSSINQDKPWLSIPPPSFEPEVAANIGWTIDPPNLAEFDSGYRSADLGEKRQVRFKAPGRYKIQGLDRTLSNSKSNVITITIE